MSPPDASIHLRARYDGRVLILEEPANLPQGVVIDLWATPVKAEAKPRRQAGSAKGLIQMRDDFDDPIEDFAEYR